MENLPRKLKITSLVLLIQTILWVIFTGISMSQVESGWNNIDFIRWAAQPDIFFIGNYINATLLTITVILLFTLIFTLLKTKHQIAAFIGLVFIPIYGALNLICYSIQISIVPSIASNVLNNQNNIVMVSQLIQADSSSLIGFINGLAYAILGISSIIYGMLLFKELKKFSGSFLLLNGIFCIIGIIGYCIGNSIVAMGIMIGGVLFLISLIFMVIEFNYNE